MSAILNGTLPSGIGRYAILDIGSALQSGDCVKSKMIEATVPLSPIVRDEKKKTVVSSSGAVIIGKSSLPTFITDMNDDGKPDLVVFDPSSPLNARIDTAFASKAGGL